MVRLWKVRQEWLSVLTDESFHITAFKNKIFLIMKKISFIIVALIFLACTHEQAVKQDLSDTLQKASNLGMLIADTIIYDVIIRSTNPDDAWVTACLRGLKRAELIDSLFAMVYDKRLTAFDFDTHRALRIKDIEKIEAGKDFAREKIGKIQFKERWFFDPSTLTMNKEIISIVLGYEVFDDVGELRGYKPVFQLNFN
jgi:hypothetical protein